MERSSSTRPEEKSSSRSSTRPEEKSSSRSSTRPEEKSSSRSSTRPEEKNQPIRYFQHPFIMKIATVIKPNEKRPHPPWADLILKLNVTNIREALPSVLGHPGSVLLLRNDVKITDKDAVMQFFSSFKSSAVVKYFNQEIGYFLSAHDKNMDSRLIVTHYALKV